ncbi:MAG TPA: 50S ribosomal protein L3 [Acidimicrobiia bacterium]|jgi:large subunit ribosomal protein L3|nr:50S ribosomal protein L3 [Acidimicrobiia bacterium]
MKAIIGEKLGMTQVFDDDARIVPVTVIKAGPVRVTQVKTPEKDGYAAIQISFKELRSKHVNRAQAGHFGRAGVAPSKHIVEVRVDDAGAYQIGQELTVGDIFAAGQKADVTGISKGKGFAGSMKRHNFKGQGASHGAHKVHRAPGAIGACATPARVFKGKRMPGRMGGDKTTVMNLDVVQVDAARNLLMVRGAVPGPKGAVLVIREAVKASA